MEWTTQQLAAHVGGRLSGDGAQVVRGAAGLAEAGPSDVSFLRDIKNTKAMRIFAGSRAGVVLVPNGATRDKGAFITVNNPQAAFAAVLGELARERSGGFRGIHSSSYVAPSARIGRNVTIGPFCVVEEGAEIGDDSVFVANVYLGPRCQVGRSTKLYPSVVVREDVRIGDRCTIHAGTVIGADGFGFFFADGRHNKIPQVGNVVIGDDVEIGACTTIDRATTGSTTIGNGAKIDNLVQIAHNVEVGPHSLIVAQVGIAGSCRLGQGAVLGGQVGVADHVTIGDGAQVGAQSGIKDDVPPGGIMWGSPAQPITDTMKQMLLVRKLPDLFKDVKRLKEASGSGE